MNKLPENFVVFGKQNKTYVELCTINKNDDMYKKITSIINDNKYFWTRSFITYVPSTELISDELSINVFKDFWIVHYKNDLYGTINITKKTEIVIEDFCYNKKQI